ncbi:hypothetical protein ACIBL6_11425 [Streptomyces sp. NPDC050400]|uniref:hypothetical protein n=1 Tax=Streptomyces sp. NPDC050400 TaxID=3365610 RepID=UPI0037A18235
MKQIPALLFVLHVACALCKVQVARLEFAPPGVHPASWYAWAAGPRRTYAGRRDPDAWWLIVESDGQDNGLGENVTESEVLRYRAAFVYPRSYDRVHTAGLKGNAGYCDRCDVPYCRQHWGAAHAGQPEKCPRGHGR